METQTTERKMTPIFSKFSSFKKDIEEFLNDFEKTGKSLELSLRNRYYSKVSELQDAKEQLETKIESLKEKGSEKIEHTLEDIEKTIDDMQNTVHDIKNKFSSDSA